MCTWLDLGISQQGVCHLHSDPLHAFPPRGQTPSKGRPLHVDPSMQTPSEGRPLPPQKADPYPLRRQTPHQRADPPSKGRPLPPQGRPPRWQTPFLKRQTLLPPKADTLPPKADLPPSQGGPPSPRGQTDVCENINFQASLRYAVDKSL